MRKKNAVNRTEDIYAQLNYAEALNRNRKLGQTIEFLKPLDEKHYEESISVREILDALYSYK